MRQLTISYIEIPWSVGPIPGRVNPFDLTPVPEGHCCVQRCKILSISHTPPIDLPPGMVQIFLKFFCATCGNKFDAGWHGPSTESSRELIAILLTHSRMQTVLPREDLVKFFPQLNQLQWS